MTTKIDYSPADVTALPAAVALAAQNPRMAGWVTFSRGAALQWALSLATAAEAIAMQQGFGSRPVDTAAVQAAMATPGADLSTVMADLGGGQRNAASKLLASGMTPDASNPGVTPNQVGQGPCAYLAAMATIEDLYTNARGIRSPQQVAEVRLAGEAGQGLGFLPALIGAAPYIVGAVGVVAAAGAAWILHDQAIEIAKGQVAIEVARITKAAQVQAAVQIAQAQIAAGQPVNLPAAVSALGIQEARETRYAPIVAGVGLAALGGLAFLANGR